MTLERPDRPSALCVPRIDDAASDANFASTSTVHDAQSHAAHCPRCAAIAATRASFTELTDAANNWLPTQHALEREMVTLQRELRTIGNEITRVGRALRHLADGHLRCAHCGSLAGPGHAAASLRREPRGTALVCASCHASLRASGGRVAAQPDGDDAASDA